MWGWLYCQNIQFKIIYSPTYISFENTVTDIGSSAKRFLIACVFSPPGLRSDAFFDNFSISLSTCPQLLLHFLCGDFNIDVDTTSNDSVKFLNCLETCNITQHVHTPTHLHGHILDLVQRQVFKKIGLDPATDFPV